MTPALALPLALASGGVLVMLLLVIVGYVLTNDEPPPSLPWAYLATVAVFCAALIVLARDAGVWQ